MKSLFVGLVLMAHAASAAGAFEVTLSSEAQAAARREIAAARGSSPGAFAAVAAVRDQLSTIDAKKRGRFAPIARRLNAIPNATWALVSAIVFDGAVEASLPRSAKVAWQAGLVEALGSLRDLKTEAVLTAVVRLQGLEPEVARSAAEGLGRLGTDSAAATLIALASTPGPRRAALLAGVGACRRVAMAEFLSRQLATTSVEAEQRALVKALSVLGNAWALETPSGALVKTEVQALRAIAAGALVKFYATSSEPLRQQAFDAVLIVNAPETPVLLAQQRAANPAAIDALSQRLSRP